MKALSLTQPWATLVALGIKKIETRSWQTSHRGPLAIHASKGLPEYARKFLRTDFIAAMVDAEYCYPLGYILATVNLVDCLPMKSSVRSRGIFDDYPELELDRRELALGDFSEGRFAWVFEDMVLLPEPIPAKGALGLWEWKR